MVIAFGVILAVFIGVLLLPSIYRVFVGVPLRALRTKLAARAAAAAAAAAAASAAAEKPTADKDRATDAEISAAAAGDTGMQPRASTGTRASAGALSMRGSEGFRSRGAASSSSIREISPAAAALPRNASSGVGSGSAAARGAFSSQAAQDDLESDAPKDTQKRGSKATTAAAAAAAADTAVTVQGSAAATIPAAPAAGAGATHKESGLAFPTPAWLERSSRVLRLLQPAFNVRKHVLYAVSTVCYPEGQSRVLQVSGACGIGLVVMCNRYTPR